MQTQKSEAVKSYAEQASSALNDMNERDYNRDQVQIFLDNINLAQNKARRRELYELEWKLLKVEKGFSEGQELSELIKQLNNLKGVE